MPSRVLSILWLEQCSAASRRGRYLQVKLHKLEESLEAAGFVLEEVVPLFAALCSLPLPERYPPLNLAPQRQKQQMLEAVLAWLLKERSGSPCAW